MTNQLDFAPVWPAIDSVINALENAREVVMKLSFIPRRTLIALQHESGMKKRPRFTYKTKKGYGYAKRNRR